MDLKDKIMKYKDNKWFIFLSKLISNIRKDEVTAIGAQLTYYLILSLFPFLIFLLNIIGHISVLDESILDDWLVFLPTETQILIKSIVNEIAIGRTDRTISLSLIFTLWSSSLGISAIIRAINKAYNIERRRNYIRQKIISIIFAVALAFLLIIVLLTLVFGETLGNTVFSYIGATEIFYKVWGILRTIIPIVSMIIIFGLLYKYSVIPNKRIYIRFIDTLPGAIFTTVVWIISSSVFSFYVNNFAHYSRAYGRLAGVIVLLIWLYLTSITIVLGGEINGTYANLYLEGKKDYDRNNRK